MIIIRFAHVIFHPNANTVNVEQIQENLNIYIHVFTSNSNYLIYKNIIFEKYSLFSMNKNLNFEMTDIYSI